jgi:3-oxoacyl-[acyl-carrier-protein] synthase II
VELAARSILRGQADVAIVAGTCTWIGPISLFEMDTIGLLSQCHDGARSVRPFDRRRDGFITGEGAAALVLEAPDLARRRGASVLGTLRGFGSFTQVNPTGGLGIPAEATEKAVAASLREAGIAPAGLAFVSPHGNGTRKGDHAELLALARVLDSAAGSVPVCGLKPYTGHMGAASDIAEIALGLVALRHGLLPATLNFGATDKDFSSLQVIGEHRPTVGKHFLSMSQGLGGQSFAAAVSAE